MFASLDRLTDRIARQAAFLFLAAALALGAAGVGACNPLFLGPGLDGQRVLGLVARAAHHFSGPAAGCSGEGRPKSLARDGRR